MNEQILKLALQASKESFPINSIAFIETLAELIVRECVTNLEVHSTCFDGDVSRGIKTAARLTKEHFGVE